MTKYPVQGNYGTYMIKWEYDEFQDEREIQLFIDTGKRFFGRFKLVNSMYESELYESMVQMKISTTNHYIAESVAMVALYEDMVEVNESIDSDARKYAEADRKELKEWDGVIDEQRN